MEADQHKNGLQQVNVRGFAFSYTLVLGHQKICNTVPMSRPTWLHSQEGLAHCDKDRGKQLAFNCARSTECIICSAQPSCPFAWHAVFWPWYWAIGQMALVCTVGILSLYCCAPVLQVLNLSISCAVLALKAERTEETVET